MHDDAAGTIASGQQGLITRGQARQTGITMGAIRLRLETGRWEHRHAGVYAVVGAPNTWEQRVLAACLAGGAGSAASHHSAAALWGLGVDSGDAIEITIPRRLTHRLDGVVAHRSIDVAWSAPCLRNGIPVTAPARTLVDLGAVAPPWIVERALDTAVARQVVTLDDVREELDRLARKGRRGVGTIRALLAERADVVGRPSLLEAHMLRLCRRHDLPLPLREYEVRVGTRLFGRVDFAFPECRLAIEVDGYEHHSSPAAFRRDRARQNDLVAAGWTPLRYTWADVTGYPERVAASILRVLGALKVG